MALLTCFGVWWSAGVTAWGIQLCYEHKHGRDRKKKHRRGRHGSCEKVGAFACCIVIDGNYDSLYNAVFFYMLALAMFSLYTLQMLK